MAFSPFTLMHCLQFCPYLAARYSLHRPGAAILYQKHNLPVPLFEISIAQSEHRLSSTVELLLKFCQ
ncbi:hypothetical protein ZOSMA_107G00530 [Zostera marina]|uniref:Uncharacterized protein n=1 Tax=Zostera marina TaxID=29655 RepID=A0A0K9Q459_ZOSMR|nr:hypothetical protein ZOSMA_107G00530 [Zostera marina]